MTFLQFIHFYICIIGVYLFFLFQKEKKTNSGYKHHKYTTHGLKTVLTWRFLNVDVDQGRQTCSFFFFIFLHFSTALINRPQALFLLTRKLERDWDWGCMQSRESLGSRFILSNKMAKARRSRRKFHLPAVKPKEKDKTDALMPNEVDK